MAEQSYLEPIRNAALAVLAAPPPLTEWEAGAEDNGAVIDSGVEKLLTELDWPTRTRTFTARRPVSGTSPRETVTRERTERYFPGSWLEALARNVSKYTAARDADQNPTVPDHLRLRKLPLDASYDAVRTIMDAAWEDAWGELECSVAVMCPYDAESLDGLRHNFALRICYAREPGIELDLPLDDPIQDAEPLPPPPTTFEGWLRAEEDDLFPTLRTLESPKWRAWFLDTFNDRIAIHETLAQCGVEVTEELDDDLQRARFMLDMDTSKMTIEELVFRLDARHRFFVSVFKASRETVTENEPAVRPAFAPRRVPNRPSNWNAIMELVGRLKGENMRWKEIKEQVEATHGYRFDSDEALRKSFERWVKGRASEE